MDNLRCPVCGESNYRQEGTAISGNERFRCRNCKRRFTITTALKEGESPEIIQTFDADHLGFALQTGRVMSLDQLLDRFRVDRNLWEVTNHLVNKWDITAFARVGQEKIPFTHENFQVKAWLKKKIDIAEWGAFKREFIAEVKKTSPQVPSIERREIKSDYDRNLLEPNLYDLHLGKLGWNPETRDGNFDYRIACDRAEAAIDDLIIKSSVYHIDRILLPWGHDFFNSDYENTGSATTHAGTQQQNEGRWQKMWKVGRELTVMIIEKLKTIAPVDVVIVPGNHDMQKMFYLGDLLEVKYENDENVTINNDPKQRKYYRYGNTLFGLTHKIGGKDAPNEQRLLQLMPAERESRQDFAETEFHEWHIGHLHHRKRLTTLSENDHQGITIRQMRSLTNNDAWHSNMGYVGAVKGAEAYIYNYITGPEAYFNHNIIFEPI